MASKFMYAVKDGEGYRLHLSSEPPPPYRDVKEVDGQLGKDGWRFIGTFALPDATFPGEEKKRPFANKVTFDE